MQATKWLIKQDEQRYLMDSMLKSMSVVKSVREIIKIQPFPAILP